VVFIAIEPLIDGIRFTSFEDPLLREGIGGHPVGNLEQTGGPLAEIGTGVVVAGVFQLCSLISTQG
jgi:hypothetical protein